MKVVVDGKAAKLVMAEPDNLKDLSVVLRHTSPEQAATLLWGVGRLEDLYAWLRIEAVRALSPRAGNESWDQGFDHAMDYARENNWTDPTGTYVRAHIELPSRDV